MITVIDDVLDFQAVASGDLRWQESWLLFFFCTKVMAIWVEEIVPHTIFHLNQVVVELLCADLMIASVVGAPDDVPIF